MTSDLLEVLLAESWEISPGYRGYYCHLLSHSSSFDNAVIRLCPSFHDLTTCIKIAPKIELTREIIDGNLVAALSFRTDAAFDRFLKKYKLTIDTAHIDERIESLRDRIEGLSFLVDKVHQRKQ